MFDETSYDKYVTDINNQNVKDKTSLIKNICGITDSINPETFKKILSEYIVETMDVYRELEQSIFLRE